MIINFSFKNFKSYLDDCNLLLTTTTKIRRKEDHKKTVNSLKVLKFAGIYGDNASGKTNVVNAMSFFQNMICFPNFSSLTGPIAFKDHENEPTLFKCVFSIKDIIYEYGFEIVLSSASPRIFKVTKEYLNIVGSGPVRGKYVYDSSNNKNPINPKLANENDIMFMSILNYLLKGYKELSKTNPSKLFLSYINESDKRAMVSSGMNTFSEVFDYLKNNIVVIGANTINLNFFAHDSLQTINKYTKKFDKGLESIDLQEVSLEVVQRNVPQPLLEQVSGQLTAGGIKNATLSLSNKEFYFISRDKATGDIKFKTLTIKHKYINKPFTFSEESEGTRKFIILMSYFSDFKKDKAFIIDELERSMHPSSSKYLFDFFEKETNNSFTQFIFTSHNISFMNDNLRRDEIYFSDKDMFGSSILYGLTDFKTTTDQQIGKCYEDGDFRKVSENRKAY